MFRKLVLSSIAIVALSLGSFSVADAQTGTSCFDKYNVAIVCSSPSAIYPPGGFGSGAAAPTPQPTSSTVASADNVTATGTTDSAIAFTGSESRVLGYAGVSLIGLGAVALVAARRRSDSEI